MEDITDADYMHAKKLCKDFEMKNYVNIMICILKVILYFRQMFFKTYNVFRNLSIRPCKIYFSLWIRLASSFKKGRSKIKIIN